MIGISTATLCSILMPLVGILGNLVLRNSINLRDSFTFLVSVLTFGSVFIVFILTGGVQNEELSLFEGLCFKISMVNYTGDTCLFLW